MSAATVSLGQLTVNDGTISFGANATIDPIGAPVVMNGGTANFSGSIIAAPSGDAIVAASGTSTVNLSNGAQVSAPGGYLYHVNDGATGNLNLSGTMLAGDIAVDNGGTGNIALNQSSALMGLIGGAGANVSIDAGSQWALTGSTGIGALNVGGLVDLGGSAAGYRQLNVGNLVGNNGTVVLHTYLGGDGSPSDQLVLTGSATGHTYLSIVNTGGAGNYTMADGIQLVNAQTGATTTADAFALAGRVVAGANEYLLQRGGAASTDSWYLRSEMPTPPEPPTLPEPPTPPTPNGVLRPEVAAYQANLDMASSMFNQLTLHQREGDAQVDTQGNTGAGWATFNSAHSMAVTGGGQLSNGSQSNVLRIGAELGAASAGAQRADWGVMAGIGDASGNSISRLTGYTAKNEVHGASVGIYGTWMQDANQRSGAYVDGWLQYGHYSNRVEGLMLAPERYSSSTLTASIEAGYTWSMGDTDRYSWYMQPQIQLIGNRLNAGAHTEAQGSVVEQSSSTLTSRLGMRWFGRPRTDDVAGRGDLLIRPFFETNVWHYGSTGAVAFDGVNQPNPTRSMVDLKLGAQAEWGRGWSGWIAGGYNQNVGTGTAPGDRKSGYAGEVGARLRW